MTRAAAWPGRPRTWQASRKPPPRRPRLPPPHTHLCLRAAPFLKHKKPVLSPLHALASIFFDFPAVLRADRVCPLSAPCCQPQPAKFHARQGRAGGGQGIQKVNEYGRSREHCMPCGRHGATQELSQQVLQRQFRLNERPRRHRGQGKAGSSESGARILASRHAACPAPTRQRVGVQDSSSTGGAADRQVLLTASRSPGN